MNSSSLFPSLENVSFLSQGGSGYQFIPEPKNNLGNAFRAIAQTAGSLVTHGVGAAMTGTAGTVEALGVETLGTVGIDSEYQQLLETQMHFQEQMQLVTLHSNIEKSRHETKMAAARNIRSS